MAHMCVNMTRSEEDEYWIYDGRGIPLTKVCDKCEKEKLKRYNPVVLKHYNEYDVDEPIEPEEY